MFYNVSFKSVNIRSETCCEKFVDRSPFYLALSIILIGTALLVSRGMAGGSYAHILIPLGSTIFALGVIVAVVTFIFSKFREPRFFNEPLYPEGTKLVTPTIKHFCCGPRFVHGDSDTRNPLWDTWENIVLMPLGGFRRYPPSQIEMEEIYQPSPVTKMENQLRIRWLGHASFLIETEHTTILTDPNWSETIPLMGPIPLYYRSVPPGLKLEEVPEVKNVILSHTHRDHFDPPTHEKLIQKDDPQFFCPLNAKKLIPGSKKVHEVTWWQSYDLEGGVTITYVPANHASQTTATDANEYLWGGYMISIPVPERKDPYTIYFMGDSACNINPEIKGYQPQLSDFDKDVFSQIGKQFPHIDAVLLQTDPIDGQEDKHFNLYQGIDLLKKLNPREKIIPMHWGTWPFNEFGSDIIAPYRHLETAYRETDEELFRKLYRMRVGECITLA